MKDLTDDFRRRFFFTQNRGEAVQQRKSECIAQTIGKRQTGRREQPVAFAQLEHLVTIRLVRVVNVGLCMHRAFRLARAARGVEDECVVRVGPCIRKTVIDCARALSGLE
jgi:hypothetical protein